MMTYDEFKGEILKELPKAFTSERLKNAELSISQAVKPGDIAKDGVMIHIPGEKESITPTVYLNDSYEAYNAGEANMPKIISDLADVIEDNLIFDNGVKDQVKNLKDYDSVKDNLYVTLLNGESNKDYLKDAVVESNLNLVTVAKIAVKFEDSDAKGSILVKNQMLESWGITKDQLFADAKENSPNLFPPTLQTLGGIMKEISKDGFIDLPEEALTEVPILVLSNNEKMFGASSMLYDNVLSDISEKMHDSFYILPSSIHETLLMPLSQASASVDELNQMVHEVNETQVLPEERLSDTVYFFDKNTKELSIAKEDQAQEKSMLNYIASFSEESNGKKNNEENNGGANGDLGGRSENSGVIRFPKENLERENETPKKDDFHRTSKLAEIKELGTRSEKNDPSHTPHKGHER